MDSDGGSNTLSSTRQLRVCNEAMRKCADISEQMTRGAKTMDHLKAEIQRLNTELVEQEKLMSEIDMHLKSAEKRKLRVFGQYLLLNTAEFDGLHSFAFENSIRLKVESYENEKSEGTKWCLFATQATDGSSTADAFRIDSIDLKSYSTRAKTGNAMVSLMSSADINDITNENADDVSDSDAHLDSKSKINDLQIVEKIENEDQSQPNVKRRKFRASPKEHLRPLLPMSQRDILWFKYFVYFDELPWTELILYYRSWSEIGTNQFEQMAVSQFSPLLWSIGNFLFKYGLTSLEQKLNESLLLTYAVIIEVVHTETETDVRELCVRELCAIDKQFVAGLPHGRFNESTNQRLLDKVLPKDRELYYFTEVERLFTVPFSIPVENSLVKDLNLDISDMKYSATLKLSGACLLQVQTYLQSIDGKNQTGFAPAATVIDAINKFQSPDMSLFWNHVLTLAMNKKLGIPQAYQLARKIVSGLPRTPESTDRFWKLFCSARYCFKA
jgi:hypothetical protein